MANKFNSSWLQLATCAAFAVAPVLMQMPMPMPMYPNGPPVYPPMPMPAPAPPVFPPMPMPMPAPAPIFAVPGAIRFCPPGPVKTITTTPAPRTPPPCPTAPMPPPPCPRPPPMPYPMPMPMPLPPPVYPGMPMMPGPPPVYIIPLPPQVIRLPRTTAKPDSDSSSDSSNSDDKSCVTRRVGRYRKKPRARSWRRSRQPHPIISYVNQYGDVRYEHGISNKQAMRLMQDIDSKSYEDTGRGVQIFQRGPSSLSVVASDRRPRGGARRAVWPPTRRAGSLDYQGQRIRNKQLGEGEKELVFHAPKDQKITNMTVSFRVIG